MCEQRKFFYYSRKVKLRVSAFAVIVIAVTITATATATAVRAAAAVIVVAIAAEVTHRRIEFIMRVSLHRLPLSSTQSSNLKNWRDEKRSSSNQASRCLSSLAAEIREKSRHLSRQKSRSETWMNLAKFPSLCLLTPSRLTHYA